MIIVSLYALWFLFINTWYCINTVKNGYVIILLWKEYTILHANK